MKCKEYIDNLRKEYIEKHIKKGERDELIGENNIEKRDIKGYHGREILELLQNADDAYQKSKDLGQEPECELIVTINYHDNILSVSNTGTFFDENGIKAVVQGNNSPKVGYIGNKGTGFRSVLNWAEKVRIFSGDFAVEFSDEYARSIHESIKEEPQIRKQLKRNRNLYIPMLQVPYNIDHCKPPEMTTIEIVIDPEKQNDDFSVQKQLENIDLRILLFLPNTSQINISIDDKVIQYKRSISNGLTIKEISLQKKVSNGINQEESFFLFDKTIKDAIMEDDMMKSILLSIAIPKDFSSFKSKNLYSFFPLLDTESPFNCILHASYILDDHRNTINSGKENKRIIREQLAFIIDVAKKFVENNQHDIAYKIIYPVGFSNSNWSFPTPFSKFGLEDYYLDSLSKEKIFLTVNDENISVEEGPKIIDGICPSVFVGKKFNRLLKPLDKDNMAKLIKALSNRKGQNIEYEERELLDIINTMTEYWNVTQQVDVFVWWNSYWKDLNLTYYAKSLPNLLKTQDNKWLKHKGEYYFLDGDFDNFFLPNWVKVPAIRSDYQERIFNVIANSQEVLQAREKDKDAPISRIISRRDNIFPSVSFMYTDKRNIIKTTNASVDSYEKAVDFVKWLWHNYQNESASWNPPTDTSYRFPNEKDNSVVDSIHCYLGSDYNNPLAEKLFDDEYSTFPKPSLFSVDENSVEAFKSFIMKFGVKEFPPIEYQKVEPIRSFKEKCESTIKQYGDIGASNNVKLYEFTLPYIKNLEQLLTQLSTTEIIEWILNDSALYTYLSIKTSQQSTIRYKGITQYNPRSFTNSYYIDNYVRDVFNESKWITIEGKRYTPRQVLHCFNSKENQKFAGLTPVLTGDILELYATTLNVDVDKVIEVLQSNRFDFCERIIDLDSESFYSIMLKVPAIESLSQSIDISRRINRIVEYANKFSVLGDSSSKSRYFKEGEILVK